MNTLDPGDLINGSVCAPGVKGSTCFSSEALIAIKKHAESDSEYAKLVSEMDSKTQVDVLHNDKTLKALGEELYLKEFTTRFRAHAPQGNTLFSNFDENIILLQLHNAVPSFLNFDCELMDFYKDSDSPLARSVRPDSRLIQGIKSGEVCSFGTIPNTLESTENLSKVGHWVALFGDFCKDKWTIEYYNSSGKNAPAGMFKWMEQLANQIQLSCNNPCIALNVSNVVSQKGPSECGAYALHYIICRICGISYKKFREKKISDGSVEKIRKLFIDSSKIKGEIKKLLRENCIV
jgi:hypothetical protein